MKGFVYILYFKKSDKYYVGSTTDPQRRLKQHSSGHTPSTMRLGSDCELVFVQETRSLSVAREAEKRIKSWKRRDYIRKIVHDGKIAFLDDKHP